MKGLALLIALVGAVTLASAQQNVTMVWGTMMLYNSPSVCDETKVAYFHTVYMKLEDCQAQIMKCGPYNENQTGVFVCTHDRPEVPTARPAVFVEMYDNNECSGDPVGMSWSLPGSCNADPGNVSEFDICNPDGTVEVHVWDNSKCQGDYYVEKFTPECISNFRDKVVCLN